MSTCPRLLVLLRSSYFPWTEKEMRRTTEITILSGLGLLSERGVPHYCPHDAFLVSRHASMQTKDIDDYCPRVHCSSCILYSGGSATLVALEGQTRPVTTAGRRFSPSRVRDLHCAAKLANPQMQRTSSQRILKSGNAQIAQFKQGSNQAMLERKRSQVREPSDQFSSLESLKLENSPIKGSPTVKRSVQVITRAYDG
ncbi:hypothetical protein BDZ45DRAFT_336229 [Acephala macrosclerotiorum]|nr:hypothetical protein BDZ45DRAFT_336229 [Acephala macrosclerotiorum]